MKAGDQIAGRWLLEASLGRGGFGEVWKARDGFGVWAIKVLHPQVLRRHPVALADFEREATITGAFSDVVGVGDHVVRVANAGRCPTHGVHYIVMELLRGESLEARLARRGPLSPSEVMRVVDPIARVLDYAHGGPEPIVHRDLNPRNVFAADVAGNEVVKVLDFGIARVLNDRERSAAEEVLGTPQFMSPEQYGRRAVTPASDVWALGLLVFSMLTGGLYFDRGHPAVAIDVLARPLPAAGDRAHSLGAPPLPPGFDAWFARCVCRDPAGRFTTAGEAAEALRPVLAQGPGWGPGEATRPPTLSLPPTMPWVPAEDAGEELLLRLRRPQALTVAEVADLLAAIGIAAAALPPGSRQMGDLCPSNLRLVRVGGREEVHFVGQRSAGGHGAGCRTATSPVDASDLSYVAPSALHGERGASADVWSLATIAFAAFTRKRFVPGAAIEEILAGLGDLEASCPSALDRARALGVEGALPEGFDAWFARCTTAPPERRFRSIEQAAIAFPRAVQGASITTPSKAARWPGRSAVFAAGLAVGLTALIVALTRSPASVPAAPPDPIREGACGEGIDPACVIAGRAYEGGRGVGRDEARAARLYERACNAGLPRGCTQLGVLAMNGRGVERDLERARLLYTQACDGGDPFGCRDLGLYYDGQHGVPSNPALSARFFQRACDRGENRACTSLAKLYEAGDGVARDEGQAATIYGRACEAGEVYACGYLARLSERVVGAGRDEPAFAGLYERACLGGMASGCERLAWLYEHGQGVPRDDARAAALYDQACTGGAYDACASAALAYESGSGVVRDEARAARIYQRGCDGGAVLACSFLGGLYESGRGVSRDLDRAVGLHERACDAGHGYGCWSLGRLYEAGRGVERDEARAAELYQRGCAARTPDACSALGSLYAEGRGVEQDDARAVELFTQSCTDAATAGCLRLGMQYESGRGVEADAVRAAQLYQRACNDGVMGGCNNLGLLYEDGRGVARDFPRALVLFERACRGGALVGCANLGELYERGRGVARDRETARGFFERACEGGVANGCTGLRRLRR